VILFIDMMSETPIYTQLCQQVIRAIATGELKTGEDLPSVRSLAADIGVNLHTVNKAYNFLKAEGFLLVTRRKGVVVNDPSAYAYSEAYLANFKEALGHMLTEAAVRGMDDQQINGLVQSLLNELRGE